MKDRIAYIIATTGYVGLLKPAPGTWGSLVAAICAWIIHTSLGLPALIVGCLILLIVGYWAVGVYARKIGDAPQIVIDEWIGQWLAYCIIADVSPSAYASGFILFRIFDIFKPYPIHKIERIDGAHGIILDDVVAGIYAGLCALLVLRLL